MIRSRLIRLPGIRSGTFVPTVGVRTTVRTAVSTDILRPRAPRLLC